MLRYLFLLVFIVICNAGICLAARAPASAKSRVALQKDTSIISVRHFNKYELSSYSKQSAFNYHEDVYEPSLWTRFWRWFWKWVASIFKQDHKSGGWLVTFIEYLFIIAGLGAIVFMLLKMMGIDMRNIFRKNTTSTGLPYSELPEDIHHIEFDSEIERAAAQHNYRLAVRLLYLKCLKQLSDEGLINWQPDKTNNAYVEELDNAAHRGTFKQLTRQFEYVWYGEFPIDGNVFKNISLMFQQFKKDMA
jgi:hypothetical protein